MTAHFLVDTATLTGRMMRHITRSLDTLITTVMMPVAIMLMFVYVLGGAVNFGSGSGSSTGAYVTYMLPGILIMTIASGISYTTFRLFLDLQSGIFDRFNTMPIARSAVLWSHVITSLVANFLAVVAVTAVALIIGFRSSASVGAWLAVLGILTLLTLALTWVAIIPGLTSTSADGAMVYAYPLIFLPFVSSSFVPTDTMPCPVRWVAEHQPVTPIVNTIRGLFAGQPVGSGIWTAVAWCVGILVAAYLGAIAAYRHRIG